MTSKKSTMRNETHLAQAEIIANTILKKRLENNDGYYWKTLHLMGEGDFQSQISSNLYAGNAGILLFLIQLYRVTANPDYPDILEGCARWLKIHLKKTSFQHGFFSGSMGTLFVLLELAKVLDKPEHVHDAHQIAKNWFDTALLKSKKSELLHGTSGTLLGLLHLQKVISDSWIPKAIDESVESIVSSAQITEEGVYWDRSPHHIRGLLGMSHGAAGIGFVLLEIAHAFQNDTVFQLAKQAFLYEGNWYHKNGRHWPDFRKVDATRTVELNNLKKAFLEANERPFVQATEMCAWCHGAPGIGLTRLRAIELTNKEEFELQANSAVDTVSQYLAKYAFTSRDSYDVTLCHGESGLAELFLERFRIFGNEEDFHIANKIAERTTRRIQDNRVISGFPNAPESDTSLMLGLAGVGYFYLRMFDCHLVPSILIPYYESKTPTTSPSPPSLQHRVCESPLSSLLMKNHFKRTLQFLEKVKRQSLTSFFDQTHQKPAYESVIAFKSWVECFQKKEGPNAEQRILKSNFELEWGKFQLDQSIPSHLLLWIRELVFEELAAPVKAIAPPKFIEIPLQLDRYIKIMPLLNYNHLSSRIVKAEVEETPVLVKATYSGMLELQISWLEAIILQAFEKETTVSRALPLILDHFEIDSEDTQDEAESTIIRTIQQKFLPFFIKPTLKTLLDDVP